MVTKLEVGDKAFIIESNRIVREVIVLKRSRDFYTVRFVENTSGGIQLRASRLFLRRKKHKVAYLRYKYRREQDFVLRMIIYREMGDSIWESRF